MACFGSLGTEQNRTKQDRTEQNRIVNLTDSTLILCNANMAPLHSAP